MKDGGATVQSVTRALNIMECLARGEEEMSVSELAAGMDLSKSTAFGLINTLSQAGYLEQNPENRKYRLGLKLLEMGELTRKRLDLLRIARPLLKTLSEETGLTVHMALCADGRMVYVDKVDSPDARISFSQVGKVAPLYCTGIGKAALAYMDASRRTDLIPDPMIAYTKHTITDTAALYSELDDIRIRGYALDREEIVQGLRCVAAPILDLEGAPRGAVSVSGTASVLDDARSALLSDRVKEISLAISRKIGYKG